MSNQPTSPQQDPSDEPRFLTPQQVALMCGLSTDAIYRAIDRGDIPAVRLCSRLRIHAHVFEAWMNANTVGPNTNLESPDAAAS